MPVNCYSQPIERELAEFMIKLPDGFKFPELRNNPDLYFHAVTDFKSYGGIIYVYKNCIFFQIQDGVFDSIDTLFNKKIILKITINSNPYCFIIHNLPKKSDLENYHAYSYFYLGEIKLDINRYEYFVKEEKISPDSIQNGSPYPYVIYDLFKYIKKNGTYSNENQITPSECVFRAVSFQLTLPNLKFKKNCSSYSIKTIAASSVRNIEEYEDNRVIGMHSAPNYRKIGNWRDFEKIEIKGDALVFGYDTESDMDTLTFAIRNNKTNAEMIITVLNISYAKSYFIDLTKFSPGHYFIDWRKIDKCQRENPCTELIDCDGMKFYQVQEEEEASFFCNKIKLYDLEGFRK